MALAEQVILTLVSGVVVPILLESWRGYNTRNSVSQSPPNQNRSTTPAVESIPQKAVAPVEARSQQRPGFFKKVARIIISMIVGTLIALAVSASLDPESTEFTALDGVLSAVFVTLLWFLLGRFGPLSRK